MVAVFIVGWLAELVDMLAAAGDSAERPIPVAIETPRGLMVEALRASGRPVYPINPLAVARYRDRHTVSRTKSDHMDAVVLANILRTDMHAHRSLPADTEASLCWRGRTRTRRGDARARLTSCGRTCASTSRRSWRPSVVARRT
jgi:hypothetical protein